MTINEMINELRCYCGHTPCANCLLTEGKDDLDRRRCLWISESKKIGLTCEDLPKTEEGRELVRRLYLRINPPINIDEQSYLDIFR